MKLFYAVIVIVLTLLGANSWASRFDINVDKATAKSNDRSGNDNGGSKSCGSKKQS